MRPVPVRPSHVEPVRLSSLAAVIGAARSPNTADPLVTGITLDSRAVRPGDLFAALAGSRQHGVDHLADAVAAGAVAVLTDDEGGPRAAAAGLPVLVAAAAREVLGRAAAIVYGDPGTRLRTIGVTGTNGKTTVTFLLAAGLQEEGDRTGLIGTVETRVGEEVLASVRTTPEAPDLHALMAVMVERGVTALAMEVSSHALRLGRVGGVVFDVALFTNLGRDHLDFHRDLEDYYQAKASLFGPERSRLGVVNLDDPYGRRLAAEAGVPVTTYSGSGDPRADWRAVDVCLGPTGSRFTALGPAGERLGLSVALPGRFNLDNALASLATLVAAGVAAEPAAAGIAACPGVPGRMERVEAGQEYVALVDYAHTPDAVETLLAAVRPLVPGRVIVVLGCGGDRDAQKRPEMGAAAARGADVVVVTDDNPRSEDPAAIRAAMLAGASAALDGEDAPAGRRVELLEVADRMAAIETAVGLAAAGDAVVVAGKGHETGQETAGVVRPFDDRVALRAAVTVPGDAR